MSYVAQLKRRFLPVATAVIVAGLLVSQSAVASTAAGNPLHSRSCADRMTTAADAFASQHHLTAKTRRPMLRHALRLCAGVTSTGAIHVAVSADRLQLTADTTTPPTTDCAASVTSQMPAGMPQSDIDSAVTALCSTDVTSGIDVAPAPAPPASPAAGNSFPGPWTVYETTAWEQQCATIGCAFWKERIAQLYFWNGVWAWHHLAGYMWSYVNCNNNDGTGFAVDVNACFWAGPNPGERFGAVAMTANVQYHVSFVYHGSPVSVYHCMYMGDPAGGKVRNHTC